MTHPNELASDKWIRRAMSDMGIVFYDPNVKNLLYAYYTRDPVLIWGPPGVGKTSAIEMLARKLGIPYWQPTVVSREDMAMPRLNEDHIEMVLLKVFKDISSSTNGVVVLDELNIILNDDTQYPILRFLDSGVVANHRIPESIWRVGIANPPEYTLNSRPLSAAIANRLTHLNWDTGDAFKLAWCQNFPYYWGSPPTLPDIEEEKWATARSIVSAFIRANPDLLLVIPNNPALLSKPWPSPRTWTKVSRYLALVLQGKCTLKDIEPHISGAVGSDVAETFLEKWLIESQIPDPEEVLKDVERIKLPSRMDMLYAIINACSAYVSTILRQGDDTKREWAWNALWRLVYRMKDERDALDIAVIGLAHPFRIRHELGLNLPFPGDIREIIELMAKSSVVEVYR